MSSAIFTFLLIIYLMLLLRCWILGTAYLNVNHNIFFLPVLMKSMHFIAVLEQNRGEQLKR